MSYWQSIDVSNKTFFQLGKFSNECLELSKDLDAYFISDWQIFNNGDVPNLRALIYNDWLKKTSDHENKIEIENPFHLYDKLWGKRCEYDDFHLFKISHTEEYQHHYKMIINDQINQIHFQKITTEYKLLCALQAGRLTYKTIERWEDDFLQYLFNLGREENKNFYKDEVYTLMFQGEEPPFFPAIILEMDFKHHICFLSCQVRKFLIRVIGPAFANLLQTRDVESKYFRKLTRARKLQNVGIIRNALKTWNNNLKHYVANLKIAMNMKMIFSQDIILLVASY
jgi:hypothetical protein